MLGLRFAVCLVFDGLLLPWFIGGVCGLIWWQYLVGLVKTRCFSGAFSVVVYGLGGLI